MAHLRSLKAPLLFGLACFLIYNANLRQIGSGDSLPARYLPLLIWHAGTFDLRDEARLVAHGHPTMENRAGAVDPNVKYLDPPAYWMIETPRGHLASLYPVVTPLLVSPLYFPAAVWLNIRGWEQPRIDRVAELMEKLSASLLATIASVLMFLVLRREGSVWSLPLAIAFAFGTNTWMISSQALWQHGTGELLIALALLLMSARISPVVTTALGAVCVLMPANRPPDALIAGAIVFFVIWSRPWNAVWLAAGAAIPFAALLYYNLSFIGNLAGGYALATAPASFFQPGIAGIAALLVSPTRGLLIFTPFLVFVPIGLIQRLRNPASRAAALALSLGVAAQFILYSQVDWRAGVSWGPRWLTDTLPVLLWMLAPAVLVLRPITRRILMAAIVASVGVQAIGAFWYTHASDERIYARGPMSMRGAWDPRNLPFLLELRHPSAGGDLRCGSSGAIDRVGATAILGAELVPTLRPGDLLEGWALVCRQPPTQAFLLIDGIVIGWTKDFSTRSQAASQEPPAYSWSVSADTRGVVAGEHVLQLALAGAAGNDIRIVREQLVKVPASSSPTDLPGMAERATALLRERQSKEGYWITSHTPQLRFESPRQEMGTFLTSVLVDQLSPIAGGRHLEDVLERARAHLAAQIESNGLVRYHGLPDAPTIGTLGCAITPDADDTSVVWRAVGIPKDDPRRLLLLEALARYRDERGLYRTWLGPIAEYQCVDPGTDPNPVDATVQMHIYLMLREADPAASRKLCDALKPSIDNERLWVYYAKAPLVPYLRSAELRRLGCNVPLLENRLTHSAEGQELWSQVVRYLVASDNGGGQRAIQDLLVKLGRDDFAEIRRSPPLLYHNDLTAKVSRFYWTEDLGYALWLRLYEASGIETKDGH